MGLAPEDADVLLAMSSDLLGVFDPGLGLVWANGALPDGLGWTASELEERPLTDVVHPDDVAEATDAVARAVVATAGGGGPPPGAVLTRCRAKDGGWRWLEWRARLDPGTGLICGAARDVTARRAARAARAASESRLQAILDHSSAAIFVKDLEGRYVLVNEAFVAGLGIERHQVLGRRADEVWPGAPIDDEDGRVLALGETFTRDDVVELADGVHRVMSVRFPLFDAGGAVSGMAAIATDITEQSRVEAALDERQRLLDTVITACPDIVAVLDGSGRVGEISEAVRHILGYELDDPVLHDDPGRLVHPEDLPGVHREYRRILATSDVQGGVRYRVRHADGRWIVLDTRAQAITGDDGKVAGVVLVSRDVTDDLEIENQMRAAVDVAEQASRAKSDFLSRMSHELRTPLNSVLGFSQLLEMDELAGPQGEAVGHIMRAGRHLLNLIDEVLDIARIESGNLELLLEPVRLHDVVGDAVDLAGPMSERAGIEVVFDVASCPPGRHALGDRQRLLQVLLNLLSNAVKYNHPGGRVDVGVEPDGAGSLRIVVADTGNGIDPADIDRVFEPFDRLGAERSTVEGTGVGLTLSKHLVERMGGVIEVRSSLGRGTTFTVALPEVDAPREERPSSPARADGPPVATAIRVLHVEDNLANLELVEQALRRTDVVELYAAMTGALGLDLARRHRPDVILLDLHLPDMSGIELLRRLQDDPATAAIPVVVVTADATPAQVQRVRGNGVAAYLTKPIEIRELLRVVEVTAGGGRG
ncbi:MAG TPA: PAS domain S-box protein [Acidimicrobiales bacterium]|nr:PAS domain S-box protein [Acidimicrobiales bacterium]